MAVEECMKQVFSDEDDDDAPLIFKRNNTSSRQNKPSSEPRKVSSKKCDVSSGKQSSDKSALNGEASNSQKAKAPSATKSSYQKSTTANSVSANSQSKQSMVSKMVNHMNDDTKRIHLDKPSSEANNPEDSDDDIPLNFISKGASVDVRKSNALNATKSFAQKSTTVTVKSMPTDSQSKQSMEGKMASDDTKRTHLDKPRSEANDSEDSDYYKPSSIRSKGASVDVRKSNALNATKSSAQKSTTVTVKSMPTDSQSKQSMEGKMASDDTKRTHLDKPCSEANDSEDSDDYKPLSIRSKGAAVEVQKSKSSDAKRALKPLPGNTSENNDRKKMKLDNSLGGAEDSVTSHDGEVIGRTYFSQNTSSHQMKIVGPLTTTSPVQKIKEDVPNNSDDSEDDKPLSKSTVGAFIKKLPESNEEKPVLKTKESCKKDPDDSDDDVPLVNRFQSKSNVGLNGSRKDLGAKTGNKRPLSDGNNSTESSLKKAKMSGISTTVKVKHEPVVKKELKTEDDDNIPFAQRLKKSASSNKQSSDKKMRKVVTSPLKKGNKKINKTMKNSKYSKSTTVPPESGGAKKWTTLEHSGVIFPPPYKPHGVKMLYNGQPVDLTPEQEEVATMFAVMKDTDYASKPKFVENFMNDWRQILGRNHVIKKFELCDFTPIYEWHLNEKEKKKQMTTEDKKALKEEKLKVEEKYMWATVDGVKEKVGNFRVEPPGLFRGRGEHPKMGKLKKRIHPRDITINIGKKAPIPECPVPGERWKEVRHDNTVTWLAYWLDPINQKEFKYVFLAASSSLKGQSDKEKYEKARLLKNYIHQIRANYTKDFYSKDATRRQISVATYLIDKLALRAGNEKDDDEADTVGCCTLKVENVVLVPPNKLQFDFLGKDSIRYFNTVEVELPVYKAIGDFRTAKKHDGKKKSDGDDLFDMLDTSKLNAHLKELMPGLTAKVFRTYNASITLDEMLSKKTRDGTLPEKVAVYQHANKEVAIICNHQRSVSKTHDAQMTRLNEKIDELKAQREELDVDLSRAKKGKPPLKDAEGKTKKNLAPEVLEKKLMQVDAKIEKMELDKKIKDDLKTVALGTSKINYLDPRITVAWCKRLEVPIEKIFNKSLLAKFTWAMDVEPSFRF